MDRERHIYIYKIWLSSETKLRLDEILSKILNERTGEKILVRWSFVTRNQKGTVRNSGIKKTKQKNSMNKDMNEKVN